MTIHRAHSLISFENSAVSRAFGALEKSYSQRIVGKITTFEVAMEEAVSAADANRNFSSILRSVRKGHSFVITSHGRPVARIIPADELDDSASAARAAHFARLKRQSVTNIGSWTRDELYEDEK